MCVLATAAVALGAAAASAQVSVEVSPLRVELKAAPAGQTTQAVTLTNTGSSAVRVRATLSDWYLAPDGSPQFRDADKDPTYSATPWVRIAPPEQVIEPNQDGLVRFSLAVPAGTAPASYRTSILFEFAPASGAPIAHGRDVIVRSRIATLLYITVGDPPAVVELVDLRIRPKDQGTQIVAFLENTGRRSVRTRGTLRLYDGSGALVREEIVPDVPVLPESEREVAIVALDPAKPALPAGDYRVEVKIDVGLPALIVGETTLKVP